MQRSPLLYPQQFTPADAEFLASTLPKLPGDDQFNWPVTLELNGAVIVRANAQNQAEPTEVALSQSACRGEPFDAKNYAQPLAPRDIDRVRRYLDNNKAFGRFAIILSRAGASKRCEDELHHLFQCGREDRKEIVVCDEADLLRMLDKIDQRRSPVEILEEKYHDLLLQA